MKTHKDLKIWKESIDLVVKIYDVTNSFPGHEKFGLASQMQRSAVSVPSNIAEGAARNTTKEFINYLYIALGSLSELETQLVISFRLKYFAENIFSDINKRIEKIRKQLLNFKIPKGEVKQ